MPLFIGQQLLELKHWNWEKLPIPALIGVSLYLLFLPGKSHGQRSLVGYSPWGRKESDTTERLHFFSVEKAIRAYPSQRQSLMLSWVGTVSLSAWRTRMHAQAQSYTVFPPQTTENVCIKLTSLSFLCSLLRTPGPWHNVNLALTVKAFPLCSTKETVNHTWFWLYWH